MKNTELYERDFVEWTQTTAALLRQGKFTDLDADSVAEEIESLGKSYRRELNARLTLIVAHRIKWDFQPDKRSPSWRKTVFTQRLEIRELVEKNPSLRPVLEDRETLVDAYERAVIAAADETGLLQYDFPQHCPYTLDQIMDEQFWLDNAE